VLVGHVTAVQVVSQPVVASQLSHPVLGLTLLTEPEGHGEVQAVQVAGTSVQI